MLILLYLFSSKTAWVNEVPNPGERSIAFRNYLQSEEDKAYWTKVLFIGGGGFFFMLAAGLWYTSDPLKQEAGLIVKQS